MGNSVLIRAVDGSGGLHLQAVAPVDGRLNTIVSFSSIIFGCTPEGKELYSSSVIFGCTTGKGEKKKRGGGGEWVLPC